MRTYASFLARSFAALLIAGAACGGALAQTPARNPALAQADQLMKANRAADAYALLAPLEDQLAGDPDYDYLFGISALDSGKHDKATLAFERVLAVNPAFAGARLDMGRAYLMMGDRTRARTEFETVLSQNPPAAARAAVNKLLQDIEQSEKKERRQLRVYAELALGHDSNINNATAQSIVNIPALGNLGFTLAPTAVQSKSAFSNYSAGVDYLEKFTPDLAGFAGASWRRRDNSKNDTFDADSFEVRGGVSFGPATNQLTVTGSEGRFKLDANLNRKVDNLGADWRYAIDPTNQLSAFSQYSRFRFTDVGSNVNSFNSTTSGVGYLRLLADNKLALSGTLLWGKERDRGFDGFNGPERRADGEKRSLGWRVSALYQVRADLELSVALTQMSSDYARLNAGFQRNRGDDLTDFSVGATWRFMKDWSFRPSITHTRNTSNIPLNAFRRTESMLAVRKDFDF